MDHLEAISVAALQDALDDVEGAKPAQRLLAAIAYKHGVTQTELAAWYGVERRTIYSWLMRLDTDEPLARAVEDEHRSGRPRKLSETERAQLERTLHEPPSAAGYDAPAWTPELVRTYLATHHDVEYSRPSCRRLMKEVGLRYQRPPRRAADAERDDGAAGRDGYWVPR